MKRQKSLVDFCRDATAQKRSRELREDRSTSSSASIGTGTTSASTLPSDSDLAASDGDDDDPVSCMNSLICTMVIASDFSFFMSPVIRNLDLFLE